MEISFYFQPISNEFIATKFYMMILWYGAGHGGVAVLLPGFVINW